MAFDLQGALQNYNNGGAAADLTHDFQTLAPGVTTIGTQSQGATFNPASYGAAKGGSTGLTGFLGDVFNETGHLASQAAQWLGKTAVNMATAPIKLGEGLAHGFLEGGVLGHSFLGTELESVSAQNKQLTDQMNTLQSNYKAGRISKSDYQLSMKELSQSFDNLVSQTNALNNRVTFDQKASTTALINTASDLVTILTVGFGRAATTDINIAGGKLTLTPQESQTATQWLASKAADNFLTPADNFVQSVGTDARVFNALNDTAKVLLQKSTAEVVANAGADMTAGQIARATAANIALKYPLIYGTYINPQASSIYNDISQGKYGDAMKSIGFNAVLLLSGGPIGAALKYGGDALKGISARTFGQTSFWDELSKFYGQGNPDGFRRAISKYAATLSEGDRNEFIRNLSAVEATNVAAMGGDAKAGAYRLARGMQGQYAFNLSEVSHDAAVQDMVQFAQNFREINDMATKLGLGPVAIGRLDVRDKQAIAEAVSGGPDAASRLQAWEDWKQQNPNAAAANNANFDKQIKQIIQNNADNPGNIAAEVGAIKARATVEGFPQSFVDKYAKRGYIPIQPKTVEAPFKEGTGTLVSKFAPKNGDVFTKAVQPVPILSSIGSLFTRMGLSPNASQAQVYQLFNDSMARNIAGIDAVGKVGLNELHNADMIIKQLSSYAHDQKLPIKDLRMLTTKQISAAIGSDMARAKEIQQAIARAHLEVPLAVKGLGDRAVDWSYKLPVSSPIMRQYLKIQGAMRFSFNPFFQYLRVIPKTEILTEAEGGGFIRSIFSGRGSQIAQIRTDLRSGGFLDEAGHLGTVMGGEAEGFMGATGKNLNKKLLPMQERSIAGLIDSQAQRMGMDAKTYMDTYPQNVRDTVQMIAEYDRNGNFINSPLARTLNIAFFPFRFDAKVAQIFARNLGKSSMITQVAVVNGVFKAHDFLTSPAGQAWYQQNATVIGLMNYITPFASIAEVFNSLLPGHDHSLGNFGQLGGLPFGWIPQLLDTEGLTHFNQPGMKAKTGEMFPQYVPTTDKGQLAIAIQDFLGQLFSYPGAQVGLASKTQLTSTIANSVVGANTSKDFKKVTPQPNAQQKFYQENIPNQQQAPVKFSTGQPSSQATTFGMQNLPQVQPKYKNGVAPTRRKKESQYTPALLPGQSSLGQL